MTYLDEVEARLAVLEAQLETLAGIVRQHENWIERDIGPDPRFASLEVDLALLRMWTGFTCVDEGCPHYSRPHSHARSVAQEEARPAVGKEGSGRVTPSGEQAPTTAAPSPVSAPAAPPVAEPTLRGLTLCEAIERRDSTDFRGEAPVAEPSTATQRVPAEAGLVAVLNDALARAQTTSPLPWLPVTVAIIREAIPKLAHYAHNVVIPQADSIGRLGYPLCRACGHETEPQYVCEHCGEHVSALDAVIPRSRVERVLDMVYAYPHPNLDDPIAVAYEGGWNSALEDVRLALLRGTP
jgi:hypothetical protein